MNLQEHIDGARADLAALAKAKDWKGYQTACLIFADLLDEGCLPSHACEANVDRTWAFRWDGELRKLKVNDGVHWRHVYVTYWLAEPRWPRYTRIVGYPFPFPLLHFQPDTLVLQTTYARSSRRDGQRAYYHRASGWVGMTPAWVGMTPAIAPPPAEVFWEFLSRGHLNTRLAT